LPGRQCHPVETAEFNRRFDRLATRVRDFLALHYFRSGRTEGKFWGRMQDRAMPDTLAHTLDQYEARGRLPFHEDESISRDSWSAALLGLGVIPRALDPLAAGLPLDQVRAAMAGVASELAALPARLPRYEDYLDRMR
jgi:tryptophan halogenase